MKLLIADDNAEMRALLRQVCETVAAETRVCADGVEAIQAFAEFQPDWALLDLVMPRVDGLTATRQIRALYPDARIVVLTHFRGAEYEQAAREAGACTLILKDDLQTLLPLLSQPSTQNP